MAGVGAVLTVGAAEVVVVMVDFGVDVAAEPVAVWAAVVRGVTGADVVDGTDGNVCAGTVGAGGAGTLLATGTAAGTCSSVGMGGSSKRWPG